MSQTDSKTKTIDGHTFEVFKLDPFTAQDILIDLGQAIGPALGNVAGGIAKLTGNEKAESLLDIDTSDPEIGRAVGALFSSLDKAMLRELINKMAEVTVYVGSEKKGKLPGIMAVLFRGNLRLMYQWLWFALEVNFGDFFGWVGTAIGDVTGIVKADPSQSTLPGIGQR